MDISALTDRELEDLQNEAYGERLSRLRGVGVGSAPCGSTSSPAVDAAKDCEVTAYTRPRRPYAESATPGSDLASPPVRSFAPPRSIGWAIKQLQNGARVTRRGWNGPRQWLALQVPDGGSFMTLPYVYIRTVQGDRVPWLASQTDLLACDWQLAP